MKYYIQDTRHYVGNSMLWWAKDGAGYVCDVDDAEVFTKEEAERVCQDSHFRMWPTDYINARVSSHVDMQDCNHGDTDAKV